MQIEEKIKQNIERKSLKEYVRLVLSFFFCLVLLSLYQYSSLYFSGAIDRIVSKSFFLLLIHHIGFTTLIALFLVFIYNFLENWKPKLGFKILSYVFAILLVLEILLVQYYIENYEILGSNIFNYSSTDISILKTLVFLVIASVLAIVFLTQIYKITTKYFNFIGKMYPFTIVLFSLFLATLISDKKPINENKTQHLGHSILVNILDFNKYEGKEIYPLLTSVPNKNNLGNHFNLTSEKPNIVFLILEGMGSNFVSKASKFSGFTPFLNSLTSKSLYWSNYLSNSGETAAALPSIIGSLPFGKNGFTNNKTIADRHTLFSILKQNKYHTSFNYGGNSSLHSLDKFLYEERVDYILDNKGFGKEYRLQEIDAAGITLGYPDKELYRKWNASILKNAKPRLDVFLTLSSKKPFLIPNQSVYLNKVEVILTNKKMSPRNYKLVSKNKELFASILYTDEALKEFITAYRKNPNYSNTIFIITGSHNTTELPQQNELSRYRVPFIIYSPLVKEPKEFKSLASHADIAPSILSLLEKPYGLQLPIKTAWTGTGLETQNSFNMSKEVLLFRHRNTIEEYVWGNHFYTNGNLYTLDNKLQLNNTTNKLVYDTIQKRFKYAKSVNTYVTSKGKIIPDDVAIFPINKGLFSKQENLWITSVFSGNDYDKAYKVARKLAVNEQRNRALLLCNFILSKIPGHADTEILMGRIHAWNKDYDTSINVLKRAIRKYPMYSDGYSAILDVYFWSDRNTEAIAYFSQIEANKIKNEEISSKMLRAYKTIRKQAIINQ
ncbi:MAG: sulfatase-like hydrolase/transferase [Cellulophaga sp.]